MAQHSFINAQGGYLVPATPDTKAFLARLKIGDVLDGEFKKVRNPAFHRKCFSLLGLGFEYWEPKGGSITPPEREAVRGYIKYLAAYAGSESILTDVAAEYFSSLSNKRYANISGAKSFDAFRYWVVIEAGYYDEYLMPDGTAMKRARSISFAKMDDLEFRDVYRAILDVLWIFILSKKFGSQQSVENAAAQLMSYA